MRRIVLFTIMLSFVLSTAQERKNYSLLWKIESDMTEKPSYLFGTMHVSDAKAFQFSDAVLPAIEDSDVFALEVHPDSMMITLSKIMSKPLDLKVFEDVLKEDEFKKMKERFEEVNGYPIEESTIGDPDLLLQSLVPNKEKEDDKVTFVDAYLYSQALTMQKKVVGLELIKDHMNYFDDLSKDDKREYILEYIDEDIESYDGYMEELTEIYFTGDLKKIEEVLISYESLNDSSLVRRNIFMSNSIENIISSRSNVFSAVGAAHLPGENGLIQLLKDKGYKVTAVPASFTGKAENFKVDYSKMKWKTYTNEDLGFSVEMPDTPNDSLDFDSFKIYSYKGLMNDNLLSFLSLDFRGMKLKMEPEKIMDKFVTNTMTNLKGEIIKKESVDIQDGVKYNLLVALKDDNMIKATIVFKSQVMHYLFANVTKESLDNGYSSRFLESLKLFDPKPVQENTGKWIDYVNKEGAYSIKLPSKPQDKSRTTPNPLDPDGQPYQMKMIMSVDFKNDNNYLFRYNDMPLGYFMEDTEEAFEGIKDALGATSEMVGTPKVIYQQGYEGREFEILIQGKYHSICRMFFRGNRTYLLLKQKLNLTDKSSVDDDFFKSFKFIDHALEPLKYYTPEGENFEFLLFDNYVQQNDDETTDDSYALTSVDIFHTNNANGDLYQFGYNNLKKYFKVTDLKEFYDVNIEALREWNDTITKQIDIDVNGVKGVEFHKINKRTKLESRHRIWLANKHMFFVSAYPEKIRLHGKQTDSIFYSFRYTKTDNTFDIYASKTDEIIKDLHASDTIIRNSAIGAFDYYEFDNNDIDALKDLLYETQSDSLFDLRLKEKVLYEFYNVNDTNTINDLKAFYLKPDTPDALKVTILPIISDLDYDNAYETYIELLNTAPPKNDGIYDWQLMGPVKDSLDLAYSNFNTLLKLNTSKNYRRDLLRVCQNIIEDDSLSNQPIYNNFDAIFKYAKEDVQDYVEATANKDEYDYSSTSIIFAYLALFNSIELDMPNIDHFTKSIIDIGKEDNQWIYNSAFNARLLHDLNIDKKVLKENIEDSFSRLDIMEVFHKKNRLNDIPKKYLAREEFAKLSMYHYIGDDEGYPDHIELIDSFEHKGETYYTVAFSYDTEDESETPTPYLGIVGPITDIKQESEFKRYTCYTDWSEKGDDWKAHVLEMMLDFEEYGY